MILDKKYCKEVPITGNIRLSVRSPIAPVQKQLEAVPNYCCANPSDTKQCTTIDDACPKPCRRPCWCSSFRHKAALSPCCRHYVFPGIWTTS